MIHLFHVIQHWLAVHTGTVNESGPYYGFWSGFGSDIGEVAIIGAAVEIYRKHNCHINGCWRIAHHKVTDKTTGTEYVLCKKHYRQVHPDLPKEITLEHMLHIHKKNQAVK